METQKNWAENMKKKYLLLITLCLPFLMAMSFDKVPNPREATGSFIQDSAKIISESDFATLDLLTKELEQKTTAEIAIVTVDTMDGSDVETYANSLFKRFGIGKKGKDNGILFLIALGDHKMRIEVGYGLEPILTDAETGQFLDEVAVPNFKNGDFSKGITLTAFKLANKIAGEAQVVLSTVPPESFAEQAAPPPVETAEDQTVYVDDKPTIYTIAGQDLTMSQMLYGILFLFFSIAPVRTLIKFKSQKALAARQITIDNALWFIAGFAPLAFIFGIGYIVMTDEVVSGLTYLAEGILLSTFYHVALYKPMKNSLKDYHLDCPKCKTRMKMVNEQADDAYLTEEEIAEEKAKGINYEFWLCGQCKHLERFAVDVGEASTCPKCTRKTLKVTKTVIKAATYAMSGVAKETSTCGNPKCLYKNERTLVIPKKTSSSGGGSSFGGSSGGSSFGGGSSGGGGSSRSW